MDSPMLMEVVNKQNRFLRGFAMNLTKDKFAAEDLLQETLYRAFKNFNGSADNTNLKGWLSRIMKNTFINHYRKRKRRQDLQQSSGGSGKEDFARNEGEGNLRSQEIMHLVDCLDGRLKRPFMMAYEGYSYDEISTHLNLPIGTIKSQIHWARKKLQEQIRELELV